MSYLIVLLAALFFASPASGACPPMPAWATCINDKLVVPGGGSWGDIDFELYDLGALYPGMGNDLAEYGGTHNTDCGGGPKDWLIYDTTDDPGWETDVYASYGCSTGCCLTFAACSALAGDHIHVWDDMKRHVFIKNFDARNAVRPDPENHTDILQTFQGPLAGGWIVIQDSSFHNADSTELQLGDNDNVCGESGPGGYLFQGLDIAQDAAFFADCQARCAGNPDCTCIASSANVGSSLRYPLWVVGGSMSTLHLVSQVDPVIMVGGTIESFSFQTWVGHRYYYDDIDEALGATFSSCQAALSGERPDGCDSADFPHVRPPFIQLSAVGWRDSDGDGVPDFSDSCPTVTNAGSDPDGDGVDQACDNCRDLPNPPFTGATTNRHRTGGGTIGLGQLDDDVDGRGNHCDLDFNQAQAGVGDPDTQLMVAALMAGRSVSGNLCGPAGTSACGIHDLNGAQAGIGDPDTQIFEALLQAGTVDLNASPNRHCGVTPAQRCSQNANQACCSPFSRPLGSTPGPTLGKVICLNATGVGAPQRCVHAN